MVVRQNETVMEQNNLYEIGTICTGTIETVWHKFGVLDKQPRCTGQNWSEHKLFVRESPVCAQLLATICLCRTISIVHLPPNHLLIIVLNLLIIYYSVMCNTIFPYKWVFLPYNGKTCSVFPVFHVNRTLTL